MNMKSFSSETGLLIGRNVRCKRNATALYQSGRFRHRRPLLPLALALRRVGHSVAFATTPIACQAIAPYGTACFGVGTDEWLNEDQSSRRTNPGPVLAAEHAWPEIFVQTRAR